MFIDSLIDAIKVKRSPIVVGLDPRLDLIPEGIREKHFREKGQNLKAVREIIVEFNKGIIDSTHDIVPAVKPQIAFYEQYGIEGMEAYMETCQYAREKGLLIIGDVKRGDIGSTSKAYSNAHLGRVEVGEELIETFSVDSITINPYLGDDCIEEFVKDVIKYNKGVFILVKTSNPGSGQLQDLIVEGRSIYEAVALIVDKWSKRCIGKSGYSSIGAVVGANYPQQGMKLRELMPKSYILVPGYGAQGGTAQDVIHSFNNDGLGAIVNSSRAILYAYRNNEDCSYGDAAREETIKMRDGINEALYKSNKIYW